MNLSSLAHARYTGSIADIPLTEATYDPDLAYGSSKVSNILFTLALRARLKGTGVHTTSGHPGLIMTELGRYRLPSDDTLYFKILSAFGKTLLEAFKFAFGDTPLKTIPQGTSTTLCMMLDDLPEAGAQKLYYSDCLPGKVGDNYFDALASDDASAEQLWSKSEGLVRQYLARSA